MKMFHTFLNILLSEVDSGSGAETAQGHMATQGAGPGMYKTIFVFRRHVLGPGFSLQTALQSLSTGIIWRLRRFLLGLLVTWLVTAGAFKWGQILWLGCGRRGMGRGRPLFEAQLLKQKNYIFQSFSF